MFICSKKHSWLDQKVQMHCTRLCQPKPNTNLTLAPLTKDKTPKHAVQNGYNSLQKKNSLAAIKPLEMHLRKLLSNFSPSATNYAV